MAQIEAKSWGVGLTVPEGRRVVNLDESVLRMLEPAQHRRNPVQSSYHSFKYNFKPESIDVRKPGKVQPANSQRVVQDGVALDVEQLGSNNEDKHLFNAVEQGTKDLDVFMVFDPTTGAFTMYEADSSVILTYDRAASKAASRARSKASPSSQPLTAPAATAPPKPTPAPAPTAAPVAPVSLPTAAAPSAPGSSTPAKRTAAPKPKKAKPKPVPVRPPTPPLVSAPTETEEGELELEPVSIPEQAAAMEVDGDKEAEPGAVDAEPEGILPWDALPTTSHKRTGNTSTFNAADGPDEEVFHFGGSLGASTREPPKKTQAKSGRSGGIVFPKAAPRGRDPPPRAPPPPPPVHNPEPDDEDMFEMDEVVLPGMESHSNDLEAEMMKQLQSESSDEEEEEEEGGGFDVEAFQEAMAQEVSEEDSDDDDDDDDDSSSEEDD